MQEIATRGGALIMREAGKRGSEVGRKAWPFFGAIRAHASGQWQVRGGAFWRSHQPSTRSSRRANGYSERTSLLPNDCRVINNSPME